MADCADALCHMLRNQTGFGALTFDVSWPDGAPRRALDISALLALGWAGPPDFENQLSAVYDAISKGEES